MSMPAPPRPTPGRTPTRRLETLRGPRRTTPGLRRNVQPTAPRCTNTNCSSGDVVEDDGKLICRSCGFVVSDAQLTQELTFGEAANGAAIAQGVYVGAGEEIARNPGLGPSRITGGMTSRQVTERNGQDAIGNLVAALQLSTTQKDRAFQLYKLAMAHNFIQGRKTNDVAAVCLYIACRQDTECHAMLVDFSDVLQRNVFDLGKVYSALLRELNVEPSILNLQPVNPENLIQRFAQDLEFGQDEHRIANEAVHILKRLERDWITPGRRPAGVCAAAVILAARMNNYRRTVREVVYTAKVCEITVQKRLDEFRNTESSQLTVEEFRNHAQTLSKHHDPPSFNKQVGLKRKRRRIDQGEVDPGNEDDAPREVPLTDAEASIARLQMPQSLDSGAVPIDPALYGEVSEEHLSALAHAEAVDADVEVEDDGDESDPETAPITTPQKRGRPKGAKNKPYPVLPETDVHDQNEMEEEVQAYLQMPNTEAQAIDVHRTLDSEPQETTEISDRPQQESDPQPTEISQGNPSKSVPDTVDIDVSEFADDPDVMNALLTPEERAIKERIWVTENGEYLRIQQARKLKRELAADTTTVSTKRARRKRRMGDPTPYRTVDEQGRTTLLASPAEAAKRMLSLRGFSKKLDYSVVDWLFDKKKTNPSTSAGSPSSTTSVRAGSEASRLTATSPPTTHASQAKGKAPAPIVIDDDHDDDSEEESEEGSELEE